MWDWDTPSSMDDLRSFFGLASYNRRYVSIFAVNAAAPPHPLTQVSFFCPDWHPLSLLPLSHCQLQSRTSGKVKRTESGDILHCDGMGNCGQLVLIGGDMVRGADTRRSLQHIWCKHIHVLPLLDYRILWRCTSDRWINSLPEDTVWSCARPFITSCRQCLAVHTYCRELELRRQGDGRPNPSVDPKLMMAQTHRLYTLTDYRVESDPTQKPPNSTNIWIGTHVHTQGTHGLAGLWRYVLVTPFRWAWSDIWGNSTTATVSNTGITDIPPDRLQLGWGTTRWDGCSSMGLLTGV